MFPEMNNKFAFTVSEDRATLGSDLSADTGFSEGGFPQLKMNYRPLENQSDKPVFKNN